MPRKLFVTTALPYANAPFHIGHIMEYVQADIWVRFQRLQGHKVHCVCADDTHGAPIMPRADAESTTPEELIAKVAETHKRDYQRSLIRSDTTHSTHSEENVELPTTICLAIQKTGFIERRPSSSSSTGEEDVPAGLHRWEFPVRRKDQYGDSRELRRGLRAHGPRPPTGAMAIQKGPAFLLQAPTRAAWSSCALDPGRQALPEVAQQGARVADSGLNDWDITATPYWHRIPAPRQVLYVWLDAPSATSPR